MLLKKSNIINRIKKQQKEEKEELSKLKIKKINKNKGHALPFYKKEKMYERELKQVCIVGSFIISYQIFKSLVRK